VRVGGRAWTCEVPGIRVDVGCGWLNSADRIPLIRIAERPALRSIVALLPGAAVSGRRLLANGSGRREVRLRCLEQRMESAPPASDSAADALEPIAVFPKRAFADQRPEGQKPRPARKPQALGCVLVARTRAASRPTAATRSCVCPPREPLYAAARGSQADPAHVREGRQFDHHTRILRADPS